MHARQNPALQSAKPLNLERLLTAAICHEMGVDAKKASQITAGILRYGAAYVGGERMHWPSGTPQADVDARNETIKREFNGANVVEIARKFALSRSQVYRIAGKREAANSRA